MTKTVILTKDQLPLWKKYVDKIEADNDLVKKIALKKHKEAWKEYKKSMKISDLMYERRLAAWQTREDKQQNKMAEYRALPWYKRLFTEKPDYYYLSCPVRSANCFDIFPSLSFFIGLPIKEPSIEEFLTLLANRKVK